jgi:hypothetical protein
MKRIVETTESKDERLIPYPIRGQSISDEWVSSLYLAWSQLPSLRRYRGIIRL